MLSFIVNKELQKEGRKVIVFFVDFRAVFDSIDRKLLWKALEEKDNFVEYAIQSIHGGAREETR